MAYWPSKVTKPYKVAAGYSKMDWHIRLFAENDLQTVVHLSLLAWEPALYSFEQVLGSKIYSRIYPDWRKTQSEVVINACHDENIAVWVADIDSFVAGFVACTFEHTNKEGKVYMLTLHSDYQNQGVGTKLNLFTLDPMKENEMELVVVSTGANSGYAPPEDHMRTLATHRCPWCIITRLCGYLLRENSLKGDISNFTYC